jgi:hydroxymethylglutaryl-CoA reductase (NADPH)
MPADDTGAGTARIPRDREKDATEEMAAARRAFLTEQTGVALDHVGHYSIDPGALPGNIENFTGVAQVPIGIAGPLRVDGEHARGDVFVPLATTEGTLVASYNRGMSVLRECGGVRTAVVDDAMQRAPVFLCEDAVAARELGGWIEQNLDGVRAAAEATTRTGKLKNITQHQVANLRYLRVNYTTGDAAGQNMTGKATLAACEWIRDNHPDSPPFVLSGAIDTDKKHSQINMLLTRGKRVVAEAVISDEVLRRRTGVSTREVFEYRQVGMVGAFMSGAAYNGAHAANALTALFIATGQDVANVSESHSGITYTQLRENGDYYWSTTLTSLIVATYGGGTGLPTQRECLEILGCYGTGGVRRFAEICAATVLAGDVSLTSAILAGDWVSSHDALGRNRP